MIFCAASIAARFGAVVASASANSMSGDGLQGSRRGIDNSADEIAVGEAGRGCGRGKAGVGVEAGIDVNLEDPRLAVRIDAEVDPGVAGEVEQVPAGLGRVSQVAPRGRLGRLQSKAPWRADIGLAVARPFAS